MKPSTNHLTNHILSPHLSFSWLPQSVVKLEYPAVATSENACVRAGVTSLLAETSKVFLPGSSGDPSILVMTPRRER